MKHCNYVFALLILVLVGCGSSNQKETHPVAGAVEFDGIVPVDGTVVFHPVEKSEDDTTPTPRGTIKSDGSFQMRTYESSDGAPAGKYTVTFSWQGDLSQYKDLSEDELDRLPELMPEKYLSPKTSDITVTIKEGENSLDRFKLSGG